MIDVHRIAPLTAAALGIATIAGRVTVDEEQLPVSPTAATAIAAGAGSAAIGVGLVGSSIAERTLRPSLARAGRGGAAIGAGLVAGAVTGELADRFVQILAGRREARELRETRDKLNANADSKYTKDDEVLGEAERLDRAAGDFQELPPEAAERDRPTDGRIDLEGAPVASAARALFQFYDRDGDQSLDTSEQQRLVGGQLLSIGSLFATDVGGPDTTDPDELAYEPRFASPSDLEQVLVEAVDVGGTPAIIDGEEAQAWFGSGEVGERVVTWERQADYVASIGATSHATGDDEATWSISDWREREPILYLAGIDSEADARATLRSASRASELPLALVQLDPDAPATFGIMSLKASGVEYPPYGDPELLRDLRLSSRVLAYATDGEPVVEATPETTNLRPGAPR